MTYLQYLRSLTLLNPHPHGFLTWVISSFHCFLSHMGNMGIYIYRSICKLAIPHPRMNSTNYKFSPITSQSTNYQFNNSLKSNMNSTNSTDKEHEFNKFSINQEHPAPKFNTYPFHLSLFFFLCISWYSQQLHTKINENLQNVLLVQRRGWGSHQNCNFHSGLLNPVR